MRSNEPATDDQLAREARAARRRATWSGGIARSFEDLEAIDLEAWKQVSGADRVLAIWPLTLEAITLGGHDGPPPRLQRSSGGIRRR